MSNHAHVRAISSKMWWAFGIGIWIVVMLVVLALCRVAGDADEQMQQAFAVLLHARQHRANRELAA